MIHDSILGTIGNTPVVRVNRLAPAGTTCGKKPCWSATKTGFRYADGARASTGVAAATLSTGASTTTCKLAGKGASIGVPAFSQASA